MLKSKLNNLKNEISNDLKIYVIDYILEDYSANDDDIKGFFNDLMIGGCKSGMVSGLIYYVDTEKFYDKYYSEIEELRESLESQLGESLKPSGNLKNWYAWMAFEETAHAIAGEIGLEV